MGDEGTSSQDELPLFQKTFQYFWEDTMLQSINYLSNSSQGEINLPNMEFLETSPGMLPDVLPNVNLTEISDNATLPMQLDHIIGGDQVPAEEPEPLTTLTDLDIATIQIPCEPITFPTTSASNLSTNFPEFQNPCVSLPARKDLEGFYGFHINFPVAEDGTRHSYSNIMDKVYVVKDAACPVNFSTDRVTPPGVMLRTMAMYILPDHASDVVTRCVSHRIEDLGKDVPFPEHLIHCESSRALYEQDPVTRRFSVVLPYENPQCGESFSTYIFKFTCWSSCVGGLNRRPITVIFTLEQGGLVVGRRSVAVRICACPRRDQQVEEKRFIKSTLKRNCENKMLSPNSEGNLSTLPSQMSSCSSTNKNSYFKKCNSRKRNLCNVDSSCSAPKTLKYSPRSQDLKDLCPNSSSSQKNMSDSSSQDSPFVLTVYDVNIYSILKQFKRIYGAYESLRNVSNLVTCVEQFIKNNGNSVVLDKKSSDESD